ncbi:MULTISPECIES: PaaI family thioesterase [Rhodococcus]|uniref:Medium/long-chain acyl-CoA thioesterase YigI n=1 Tax=Rhodococcus opacus RKJ300 = JCM 13270 TaxID=1165867 RepID=I0WR95_RHOOP|nr:MULTISPECIES: PaaI family thioesterase [Rhodococcus]EID78911.1 phenylacetic acid degradation protein [Rhodococcus opacus RKJ300 = JCM 13270]QQZ15527.1 PaaI family thioesterase [Rhodococcus sp. 21391]
MTVDVALTADTAQAVLAAQPFSMLVGARMTQFGEGGATLEIPVREELRQQDGFVHGGVLSYAADNALTFAAGTVLGANIMTAGFTITYLRPAQGVLLRADARADASTRRQALCRCDIYAVQDDGSEVLCAAAQGTATVKQPR